VIGSKTYNFRSAERPALPAWRAEWGYSTNLSGGVAGSAGLCGCARRHGKGSSASFWGVSPPDEGKRTGHRGTRADAGVAQSEWTALAPAGTGAANPWGG
jgi:hypothetical protein